MPVQCAFDYAIVRIVPLVEREEFINAGVIVFCHDHDFLDARIALDEARILSLAPTVDLALVRPHLEVLPRICRGGARSGPIGQLSLRERWHWLVAPRSTIVQTSAAHAGLCENPGSALDRLMKTVVAAPSSNLRL